MWRVRAWNSGDQQRDTVADEGRQPASWDPDGTAGDPGLTSEQAPQRHIDAQRRCGLPSKITTRLGQSDPVARMCDLGLRS